MGIVDLVNNAYGPGSSVQAPLPGMPNFAGPNSSAPTAEGLPAAFGAAPQAAPQAAPAPTPSDVTPQSIGMTAPAPPQPARGNILQQIGQVAKNFITQNPNTFAGNVLGSGLMHAGAAQRMYPYLVAERMQQYRKGEADIGELQARAASEQATAGKTKAETGEAQVISDEAERLAKLGYYKDKDGNLMGVDADGKPYTAYGTPTQLTKSSALLSTYIDKRTDAATRLAAAKESGSKAAVMLAQADFNKWDELATNIKDSARAYAASAEGQTAKLITELPALAQSGKNAETRAKAAAAKAVADANKDVIHGY